MELKSPVEVQVRNPLALVRMRNPLPAVRVPNPLAWATRPVTNVLGDIRKIAQGMDNLPELVRVLSVIQMQTQSLDAEVRTMRAEVNAVNARLDSMATGVEGRLDDVSEAVHPVRRIMLRLKRSKPAPAE